MNDATQMVPEPALKWMEKSTSSFAASLRVQFSRKGYLTDRQIQAVLRAISQDAERKETKAEPPAESTPLMDALNAASKQGRRPRIHLGGFILTRAPDDSRNPGAVYVTDQETKDYLGKIVGTSLEMRRSMSIEDVHTLTAAIQNPKEEAIKYGRSTGMCSCCGRELTNQESINAGIGPICQGKFGW